MKLFVQVRAWAFWLCIGALCMAKPAKAQPTVDRKAEKAFELGIEDYNGRLFADALAHFMEVNAKPFNRVTTPALYMTALCYYAQRDYTAALERLNHLTTTYPSSKYVHEANYHKGLIQLQQPQTQEAGLLVLINLSETAQDVSLRRNAQAAVQMFLYQDASLEFLRNYFAKAKPSVKLQVLEALCYRLHAQGRRPEVVRRMNDWLADGNALSGRLQKLKDSPAKGEPRPDELRIAVMLPFYGDTALHRVNPKAKPAMAFLAGMQLALQNKMYPGFQALTLKVFDTRADEATTAALLNGPVPAFEPDVIVGDLGNITSRQIAKFCTGKSIVHLVPTSPLHQVAEQAPNTFLLSPSLMSQAAKAGVLAAKVLNGRRVTIAADGTHTSQAMADSFRVAFVRMAPAADIMTETVRTAAAYDQLHSRMRQRQADVLYFPSLNQHLVANMLNRMVEDSLPMHIVGLYEWQHMDEVEPDYLERFAVYMPTPYYIYNDSAAFRAFDAAFKAMYRSRTSREALQGYDAIQVLLFAYGIHQAPISLPEALHKARPFRGLSQNYYFGTANINQSVTFMYYHDAKPVGVRLYE